MQSSLSAEGRNCEARRSVAVVKRVPMRQVALRKKRQENPYTATAALCKGEPGCRCREVFAHAWIAGCTCGCHLEPRPKRPELKVKRLTCGALWPNDYWPESKFQYKVERKAAEYGWQTSHAHLPYFDTAGIPDLFMVHPERKRMMFRELKVRYESGRVNKTSPAQDRWIAWIRAAGGDVAVWRYPEDWFSGEIDRELQA